MCPLGQPVLLLRSPRTSPAIVLIFIMLVCIIGCSTTNTEEACEILSKRPSANSTRTESQPSSYAEKCAAASSSNCCYDCDSGPLQRKGRVVRGRCAATIVDNAPLGVRARIGANSLRERGTSVSVIIMRCTKKNVRTHHTTRLRLHEDVSVYLRCSLRRPGPGKALSARSTASSTSLRSEY